MLEYRNREASRLLASWPPRQRYPFSLTDILDSTPTVTVIKSARVMKKAVAYLLPFMEKEKRENMIAHGLNPDDFDENDDSNFAGLRHWSYGVMRNDSRKGQEYNDEVIGLTGLIMPSLDEMVVVAKKMSKGGFKQPLLIGGATTSKMHTAVKISPNYFTLEHPAIHVLVASRFVTVLSSLLSDSKEEFLEDIMEECDEMREEYYAGVENRYFFLTFEQAQEQKFTIDFDSSPVAPAPPQDGNYCDRYCHAGRCGTIWIGILFSDLGAACGRYTNRGYPKISNDEAVGAKAKKLFDDA